MPKSSKNLGNSDNLLAILAIIVGIIIIAWPNLVGIVIGLYLVITGILKLLKK